MICASQFNQLAFSFPLWISGEWEHRNVKEGRQTYLCMYNQHIDNNVHGAIAGWMHWGIYAYHDGIMYRTRIRALHMRHDPCGT